MSASGDMISHDRIGEGRTGAGRRVEQQIRLALDEPRNLATGLMEKVCDRANLNRAYKRVKANRGSGGVDGMTINELGPHLREHGKELIKSLLDGSYQPHDIRGVAIPKPGGGERQLGIPTLRDRVVQQAILQVLEPLFDPGFSESSYGFRPRRGAHQALKSASGHVREGYEFVVDMDLEKFFDRVNHDILMSRLARRIGDRTLLKVIRRFLTAGVMQDGIRMERHEGTPQGGPLSPLLSNILLDELDRELERRGHRFCRYADDCNIYVRTYKAGERVLNSLRSFLWKRLKLKVNEEKSAVALVRERRFLGYQLNTTGQLWVAPQTLKRLKGKIRQLTKRSRGTRLESVITGLNRYLQGWMGYFHLAGGRSAFRDLDCWIRRRLRCYRLVQRKRSWSIATFLMKLGLQSKEAWSLAKSQKGWWRLSHNRIINRAMPNAWFEEKGLMSLERRHQLLNV